MNVMSSVSLLLPSLTIMSSRNAMRLSLAERVELVQTFEACGKNASVTARKFTELRPGRRQLSRNTVISTIRKFEKTGSVAHAPGAGRPVTKTSEECAQLVVESIRRCPNNSIQQIAQETNISKASVFRILKKKGYKSYIAQNVQRFRPGDAVKRLDFCNWFYHHCETQLVLFSDEAVFRIDGTVSKLRTWSQENPRAVMPCKSQGSPKVNVWAGIMDDRIIGPFFIDGNINGMLKIYLNLLAENYSNMIQNCLLPELRQLPLVRRMLMWFQQDGAPAHYALSVREILNHEFGANWIGRAGPVSWPPRSPDLTPLDFFLWGHLKQTIYRTPVRNVDSLRQRITEACSRISRETLLRVQASTWKRILLCRQQEGGHFEQLL